GILAAHALAGARRTLVSFGAHPAAPGAERRALRPARSHARAARRDRSARRALAQPRLHHRAARRRSQLCLAGADRGTAAALGTGAVVTSQSSWRRVAWAAMRVLGRCAEVAPGFGFAVMHSRIFAWLGLGLLMVAPVA